VYRFTDRGVAVVNIFSREVVFVGAGVIGVVVFELLKSLTEELVLGTIAYVITYLAFRQVGLKRVARYSALAIDEVAPTIRWEEVDKFQIIGHTVWMRSHGKRYNGSIDDSEVDSLAELIGQKIPDKMAVSPMPSGGLRGGFPLAVLGVAGLVVGLPALLIPQPLGSSHLAFVIGDGGMTVAADAATLFGLLNPRLLRPIPPMVVFAVLWIFNAASLTWVAYGYTSSGVLLLACSFFLGPIIGVILRPIARRENLDMY